MKHLNSKIKVSTGTITWLVGSLYGLIIMAGLLFPNPVNGQTLSASPSGFDFGVYTGAGITTLGPGITAGITARNSGHQFILRGISTDMEPAGETWEIAGLYGRVIAVRSFQVSAGVGVGVIGGKGYPKLFATGNREDIDTMIGFPVEGRVTWKPVRHAGLGLHSFANVNTVQPIGGVALTLHVNLW
ncbi:MAG: hypothetical protein R6V27_10130 [Balneolaceae bacterium]